jgi:hypothetical protein
LLQLSKSIVEMSFVAMDTFGSYRISSIFTPKRSRKRRFFAAGLLIVAVAALSCLLFFTESWRSKLKEVELSAKDPVAELVSMTGVVLTGKPGWTEWRQVSQGARLMEGDLIKTDQFANALVRYADGTTVSIKEKTIFTVRNDGNGIMDVSAPPQEADHSSNPSGPEEQSQAGSAGEPENGIPASNQANNRDNRPFMKLERIIAFGRSLELIGVVEAGSHLIVNDEIVEIGGDGAFKHFTKPFPVSAQKVRLIMKVSDLAGRTRAETVDYDFNPHRRKK